MKNIIKITTLALAVTFLSVMVLSAQDHDHAKQSDQKTESNTENHQMMNAKMMDKNKDGEVFQCEMHADQISDKTGDCSKCGMKLSKVSVDDANKKMMQEMKIDVSKINDHDSMKKENSMKESNIVHEGVIDISKIDINKDGKVYQDMMDWNVISDKPGDCPVCGMTLKEVSVEQAKKNLEKNGFKVK